MTQAFTSPITSRLKGGLFNPLEFNPYLLFDAQTSMLGELEAPTLDLDASDESTLDVITATRAGVATYTDLHGVIKTASADTVRVDWSLGYPAMLIEPSATNFVPYSEDFEAGNWSLVAIGTGSNPVITPDYAVSPDGTQNASRIQFDKGSGTSSSDLSILRYNVSVTSGLSYSKSIYLKSNTSEAYDLILHESADASGTNVKKITVTPEWQRFDVYGVVSSTTAGISFGLRNINVTGVSDTADVLAYGAQLEEGSVATSYIPTSGGSVAERTRNADNLQIERDSTNLVNYSSPTLAQATTVNLAEDSGTYYGLSNWLEFGPASSGLAYVNFPEGGLLTGEHTLSFYVIMDDGGVPVVGSSTTGSGSDFGVLLEGSSSAGLSGVVTHVVGDMYRVSGVRTCTSSTSSYQIRKYANQSERGFKVTGFQLESGEMSSLIPTSGSPESRTAFSDFFNSGGDGTFYIEFTTKNILDPQTFILVGHSGSQRYFYTNATDPRLLSYDGTFTSTFGGGSIQTTLNRAALSYNSSISKSSLNGATDASVSHSGALSNATELNIGSSYEDALHLNGHIRRILFWPTSSDSL